MNKLILAQELLPGMVIMQVTKQNGPVKIKKSGLVSSMDMVQGLVEMGIQEVEIDPTQTVEIEASNVSHLRENASNVNKPNAKKSATQKMLESDNLSNTRIDDGVSEQLHRSLFLPSVQDIPAAWQFYTKRYGLAIFIALGGFGTGWVLAHYKELASGITTSPQSEILTEHTTPKESLRLDAEKNDTNQTQESVSVVQHNLQERAAELPVEPSNTVDKSISGDNKVVTAELKSSPKSEPIKDIVKTQTSEQPISADLLARFNKAVSQVSEESSDSEVTPMAASDDVTRLDQLPAWVMTELPNMSFSAHMYASDDENRWIRVNGTRMVEGDIIEDKVQIIEITPQHVILNYKGHEFSMAALTDW